MYSLGLASTGYRLLTACDTGSALIQLKTEHPDAVVTDLQIGGARGGWEFIDAIKSDPVTRQIPVVVLTGFSDASIAATAQRSGCAAVVTKPCLPDDLARLLRRVLSAVA
jgi:CheY-like chemotaxis protein